MPLHARRRQLLPALLSVGVTGGAGVALVAVPVATPPLALSEGRRRVKDPLRVIFDSADTDGSGTLDAVEVKKALTSLGVEATDARISELRDLCLQPFYAPQRLHCQAG